MKLRILLAALLGTAVALVPVPASAKGPTEVEITGPGIDESIRLEGAGDSRNPAGVLKNVTGVFLPLGYTGHSAFAPTPPPGELGPRYVATYTTDFDDTMVRQELYPFAAGGPVVHMAPGQPFHGQQTVYGGWRRTDSRLTALLVSIGVPRPGRTGQWSTYGDADHGLSISYPPGWHPASRPVAPALIDPVIPLALGTYAFPTRGCGAVPGAALKTLGRDDAFIAIYVRSGPPSQVDRDRPARFGPDLLWGGGPLKCTDGVRATIRTLRFAQGERRLIAMVAFGPEASAKRREQTYRILDTLTVASPSGPLAPAG